MTYDPDMKKDKVMDKIMGKGAERIPKSAFYIMTFLMKIMDFFGNYSNKRFRELGIKNGQKVIDYGCGPARYLKNSSRAVGKKGRVYAVDIHPTAIKMANDKIKKFNLKNVKAIQADGYSVNIPENTADLIYALDMFHMVKEPDMLLRELRRLVKPDGFLIIDDGHQSREETKYKIINSGFWNIEKEHENRLKCVPLNK